MNPVIEAAAPRPDPFLSQRVLADQVRTLYAQYWRTTRSMLLGGLILCVVMGGVVPMATMAGWMGAIALNQAWRWMLVRAYRRARPDDAAAPHWGRRWAIGSGVAGALWGTTALLMYIPDSPSHQALLIVCLFGVILGGINLTAVYKPSFYSFAIPTLAPLIIRVALEGDPVHLFTAAVMVVVLIFILGFGHNLNDLMTESLSIRYENTDLIIELTGQKREADTARAAAEEANRAKTQFFAAASHDLRQPLHAMGLFASALSTKAKDPEVRGMVASINSSVEALEGLFNELLDISKLDSGVLQAEISPVPLARLLDRIRIDYAPLAAEKGLSLRVRPCQRFAASDPVLLERILRNLVSNAIRYTTRGGILVGCRPRGREIAIEVWDSGVGIPVDKLDRIFDEFYQIGNPERQSRKGMGLGLAIVRRLTGLLDHRLDVRSVPGRGSRFALRVAAAEAPEQPSIPSAPAIPASDGLVGRVVLVVDDEPAIVEGMRALLEQWGCEVVGGTTGDELIHAMGETGRYPDLIIADYRLQDETGLDVIARIRAELDIQVPALVVTGGTAAENLKPIIDSGLPVLMKPVVAAHLRSAVGSLLKLSPATASVPERPARAAAVHPATSPFSRGGAGSPD